MAVDFKAVKRHRINNGLGRLRSGVLLTGMALALWVAACPAQEPARPGTRATLTVLVTNGTDGGAPVAGDEVVVQVYANAQLLHTLETTVDANSLAIFDDVPTGTGFLAEVHAKHQRVMFGGPSIQLEPTQDEIQANVQVFDVSDDVSRLSVAAHHLIIEPAGSSLKFMEYMQLRNTSDMAIGSPRASGETGSAVVTVMLPKGFRDLTLASYFHEEAIVHTDEGFYDTMAVAPGEYDVRFSYTLDIAPPTIQITKGISLATSQLIVFFQKGRGTLHGLGEPDSQFVNTKGVPVEYYRRSNLAPGQTVAFQISGFSVGSADWHTWIALAVVFGVLTVLAVSRLLKRRPRTQSKAGSGGQW